MTSQYEQTRAHIERTRGRFTDEEERAAELELAVLQADAFTLTLRAREDEHPPTPEEWGAHLRRKAPLLVRLALSNPLRYEVSAREAVERWREAEQGEIAAAAAAGLGSEAERWLARQDGGSV
ncbi:hypothetical protein [Streptomyces olivaceus]